MKIFNICPTSKVAYLTDIDAALELEFLAQKGRNEKNLYKCNHCDLWHLTSGPAELPNE